MHFAVRYCLVGTHLFGNFYFVGETNIMHYYDLYLLLTEIENKIEMGIC